MTIEITLERIATALERLAEVSNMKPAHEILPNPDVYGKASVTAKFEGKPTFTADPEPTPDPVADTDIIQEYDFAQVNKSFFALLGKVRDKKDAVEARQLGTDILSRYTGGKPLSKESLPEGKYIDFMNTILHHEGKL